MPPIRRTCCKHLRGQGIETEHFDTLADGCAGGIDDDTLTLPLADEVIDELIYCNEAEIGSALSTLAWEERMIVEGAAALAYAYVKRKEDLKGQTTVVLLCGANFDKAKLQPILKGADFIHACKL